MVTRSIPSNAWERVEAWACHHPVGLPATGLLLTTQHHCGGWVWVCAEGATPHPQK